MEGLKQIVMDFVKSQPGYDEIEREALDAFREALST